MATCCCTSRPCAGQLPLGALYQVSCCRRWLISSGQLSRSFAQIDLHPISSPLSFLQTATNLGTMLLNPDTLKPMRHPSVDAFLMPLEVSLLRTVLCRG